MFATIIVEKGTLNGNYILRKLKKLFERSL